VITVGGFNTAIDKLAETGELCPGAVHRLNNVRIWPGGKGLHIAATIAALGEPVRLIGIVGPGQADMFDRFLRQRGVEFHPIPTACEMRTCLALRHAGGDTTELHEEGPLIDDDSVMMFRDLFLSSALESRVAVLAGSLPRGAPDGLYGSLTSAIAGSSTPVLLDASGDRLRLGIDARPYAVKPNRAEAADLVGRPIASVSDALEAAQSIASRGVRLVVVSLGRDGFVASWDGALYRAETADSPCLNDVGAGDCLVGGLAVGITRGLDRLETLKLAAACGAAKVLREETGLVAAEDVDRLLPGMVVKSLGKKT
jgi:tagatose 6-phosphate kinase